MKIRIGTLIVGLSVSFCLNSMANVYVTWQASSGFYFAANSNVGILGSGTGNSTIAQLIWSPDAVANDADATTANFVSGNDVWLATLTRTEDGINNDGVMFDSYAWFPAQPAVNNAVLPAGGFVYGRIFQDATPALGEWYYVGPVVAASNLDPAGEPAPSAQSYELNRDSFNFEAIDGTYGRQVVPEPASISLLVLGAAVLGLRRRRR